jgi:hypothetical protein
VSPCSMELRNYFSSENTLHWENMLLYLIVFRQKIHSIGHKQGWTVNWW